MIIHKLWLIYTLYYSAFKNDRVAIGGRGEGGRGGGGEGNWLTRKTWLALSLSMLSSGESTGVWWVNFESNWLTSSSSFWNQNKKCSTFARKRRFQNLPRTSSSKHDGSEHPHLLGLYPSYHSKPSPTRSFLVWWSALMTLHFLAQSFTTVNQG